MASPDVPSLAKNAYHAYGSVTDWKNYAGLPMPAWADLPAKIRAAWEAAVNQVVGEVLAGEGYRLSRPASGG